MSLLDSLKRHTIVVADTGDIDAIRQHRPQDATTNPSLLLKAAQQPAYRSLVDGALEAAAASGRNGAARTEAFMDRLGVAFGCEILKIVPGRVSTEVDARYSFDTEASMAAMTTSRPVLSCPSVSTAMRLRRLFKTSV